MNENYLKFICPNCGYPSIEEVLVDAVVRTELKLRQDEGNNYPEYDEMDRGVSNGTVDHYECSYCGYIPKYSNESRLGNEINNIDDLAEWMILNCNSERYKNGRKNNMSKMS